MSNYCLKIHYCAIGKYVILGRHNIAMEQRYGTKKMTQYLQMETLGSHNGKAHWRDRTNTITT
jgi:hypothetical protein